MVYLYAADVSSLPDPTEDFKVMEGLPKERINKILNAKHKQKRLQSLGAGLLLEKVLNRHGISSETIQLEEGGKPKAEGICFNLAHSGDYVLCAVSDRPVGCDIEQLRKAPKPVAERNFTTEELAYLQEFSGETYSREFFRIWTKKESYLKMLGIGIRVPLHTLQVGPSYHLHEYDISGYQITVCAEETEFGELSWVEL